MSLVGDQARPPGDTAATGAVAAPGKQGPQRWWAVGAISLSVLVVGLDLTVLTLALPTMAISLHASTSGLQWITDAYTLVLAAGILPAGILGDRFGRKKILLGALILFGLSSAACAYAASTGELIAARTLLGIGAAAVFPLSLSAIPVMFEPEEMQKAITVIASATMVSFPIGPIVGGYLLDHFWWGSVFLINVPVVVLAVVAVCYLLPESKSPGRPGIDIPGVLISGIGLVAVTYGLIKAGQDGWSDATVIATIVAGLAILAAFVWWERRTADPLVDMALFRSAGFRWGTILATLVSLAMFGLMFAMPQFFQEVMGTNPIGSGLRLLPLIGGMIVGMIAGTRLQAPRKDRAPLLSAKVAVAAGFAIMAVGIAIGATSSVSSGTGFAAAWFVVAGAGLGIAMPASMSAAMSALSADRSGSGSAVLSALRQTGATIGVAVLGTVVSNGYTGNLHLPPAVDAVARQSVAAGVGLANHLHSASILAAVRQAFVHGMDTMLIISGGIAVISAVLALAFLPRRTDGQGGQDG